MGSFFFFAWAGEYLIYYRGLSTIPGNHHFKEKSKKKVPWAVVYQNDGLRWISPLRANVMSVGAGCFYTVVLNHDGTLFASGFNINGCLAQGTRKHERRFLSVSAKKRGPGRSKEDRRSFRKIDAGMQHWLAVDDDGGAWACGSNYYGQLGIAESEALCMRPVKGFGGERVASIACGLAHSLVSTAGGRLFAAGFNSHGQLGVGDFANRAEFVAVCDQAGAPPCRVAAAAGSLAAGGWHSACVDSEGCVRAWGSVIGTQPVFGSDAQWNRAQIPVPSRFHRETFGGEEVLMVSAGHCHAVAVTLGAVFSWGDGIKGCLGHGDWQSVPLPRAIAGFRGVAEVPGRAVLKSVACGPYHNVAIHSSGSAYVWGDNGKGQLGLGDRVTRCLPTRVRGDHRGGAALHVGAVQSRGLAGPEASLWSRRRAEAGRGAVSVPRHGAVRQESGCGGVRVSRKVARDMHAARSGVVDGQASAAGGPHAASVRRSSLAPHCRAHVARVLGRSAPGGHSPACPRPVPGGARMVQSCYLMRTRYKKYIKPIKSSLSSRHPHVRPHTTHCAGTE